MKTSPRRRARSASRPPRLTRRVAPSTMVREACDSGPGVWYNYGANAASSSLAALNAPSGAGDTYGTGVGTQTANVLTLGGTWGPSYVAWTAPQTEASRSIRRFGMWVKKLLTVTRASLSSTPRLAHRRRFCLPADGRSGPAAQRHALHGDQLQRGTQLDDCWQHTRPCRPTSPVTRAVASTTG